MRLTKSFAALLCAWLCVSLSVLPVWAALSDNLVSCWSLDESNGSRADSAGSNTLTDNNTVGSTTGKVSNAAQFVAANSESLSISDNAALSMGSSVEVTIAAWVNLASKSTYRMILSKADLSGSFEYELLYNVDSNAFVFQVSSDGGTGGGLHFRTLDALGSPSTGTWYFLVAQVTSTTISIAYDGALGTNSQEHTGGVFDGTSAFRIGARGGTDSDHMDGSIDEVMIWKRLLDSSEVTEVYNSGNGRNCSYVTGGAGGGGPARRPSQPIIFQ